MNKPALLPTTLLERLTALEYHLPKKSDLIYDFGKHLSRHVSSEITRDDFIQKAENVLSELQKISKNSEVADPVTKKLIGYPEVFYKCLQKELPGIANAIFLN